MKEYNNDEIEDDFYDNEDELQIHEIIQNSTQSKRSTDHPFTARSIKKIMPIKNKRERFVESCSLFIEDNIKDKIIGFNERRRHKTGKGFSKRALQEFLEYYKDLYQEKSPNIQKLYKLLVRNGTPDMSNPYSEGNLSYYSYHPMGFIVADLEILLEGMVESIENTDNGIGNIEKIKDEVRHRDEKTWLTVSEFIEDEEKDKQEKKEKDQHLALQSWALILALGDNIDNLKKEIHIDNIEIATIETILIVKLEELPKDITIEKIVNGAIKLGALNENFAHSVLKQRKDIDSGKKNNMANYDTKKSMESDKNLKKKVIVENIVIKPVHEIELEKIKKQDI